jgi:integrase
MGLELKKGRDGQLVMTWYGRWTENGKRKSTALCDALGTPPASLSINDEGDAAFERSRKKAEGLLENHVSEASQKGHADHLTERLIEAKTGRKVEYAKLADLPALWRGIDREGGAPSEKHLAWCDSVFKRFAAAVPCEYLYEVEPEHIKTFLDGIRLTHTNKTVKDMTTVVRAAFKRLLPVGSENPFGKTIHKRKARVAGDGGMVARMALTGAQLERLYETARPDPMLYALTVCAACTGMRIGDVCQLRWQSVDLRAGWVRVATSKTGVEIEVPIFDRLREVLEVALADRQPEAVYVWPEAQRLFAGKVNPAYAYDENDTPEERRAKMYLIPPNPNGIYYRGKSLFARAFADTPPNALRMRQDAPESADLAEVFPKVSEAVRDAGFSDSKRDRVMDTLTRYARGESYREIEKATGRKRCIISQDLHDAELVSNYRLRCGLIGARGTTKKSGRDLKTLIADTRQGRKIGQHAASLLGWHNLRGTFVVLALNAGVPFETVAKCTGHTQAKTIRDHYDNQTREHTKQAMQGAGAQLSGKGARKALPEAKADPVAQIAAQLQALTQAQRAQLTAMLIQADKV